MGQGMDRDGVPFDSSTDLVLANKPDRSLLDAKQFSKLMRCASLIANSSDEESVWLPHVVNATPVAAVQASRA